MKKSIQYEGVEMFYRVEGNGEPVLLLHGFGEDSNIWDLVLPDLHKYQVILPDLPGSGTSQTIPRGKVSLSDFAICLANILDQEKIDQVHLIGHSMGGYIAMEFAYMYPGKLRSLGLCHSSAYADNAEKIDTRKKAIEFIKTNGVRAFLKTSIPGLFKDPEKQSGIVGELLAKGENFSDRALIQYYEAMIGRKDLSSILPSLKFPILFIIGEHDKAIPISLSLKQCYLAPVSFVHILRSSAHMGMCEEPDKITIILNKFLNQVTRG